MQPRIDYEDVWSTVVIIGNLTTNTFDFYLNGDPEGSDLEFRHALPSNAADNLNYLGFQAGTHFNSITDHYFDNFKISDINADSDQDGLYDVIGNISSCPYANDAVSDDDGILDEKEDSNKNGVFDPGEYNLCDADTDGDGIQDGTVEF